MFILRHISIIIITLIFMFSCGLPNDNKKLTSSVSPNWKGIDTSQFKAKFGQVLLFEIDSTNVKGVVLDFSQDDGGKWTGVCFINENRIYGRQIPDGLFAPSCVDLIDLTYIHEEVLSNYQIENTIKVDVSKIEVGAINTAINAEEIKFLFDWGISQRLKPQTPCTEGLLDVEAVRECYFKINKILY